MKEIKADGKREGVEHFVDRLGEESWEHDDYLKNAASATDMTGLIYRAVTEPGEVDSYQEVYQYLPPVKKEE